MWTTDIWDKVIKQDNKEFIESRVRGIDMRKELHATLYGNFGRKPYGHWIVYRKFDQSEYSKYWDPVAKEAVGGPKYKWRDYLLRTRRYLWDFTFATNRGLESLTKSSIIEPGDFLYYFEFIDGITALYGDQTINTEDCLYEIKKHASLSMPSITHSDYKEKYEFKRVEPIFGDYGRIEYFIVIARKSAGGRW